MNIDHVVQDLPDSPAGRLVREAIDGLKAEQAAEARAISGVACEVCGEIVAPSTRRPHPQLGQACASCRDSARLVMDRFRADAMRHLNDLRFQLPQIVRDLRAGMDEPSFYRGFPG